MNIQTSISKPWYREPWPWILMAGPIVVIVAGVITAWLAIRSYDGLVDDDYYKQGLAVNQRLARDQRATELHLSAEAMLGGNGRDVRVFLTGKDAESLPKALSLKVTHPTRAGLDQVVSLTSDGQGFYVGSLRDAVHGRWNVALEDDAHSWRINGEWNTDKQQALRLPAAGTVSSNHQGG